MAIVLMGLGPFRFAVPGLNYHKLARTFEYRWEPQWRVGSRPAQQFLGPGEEELNIRGVIFPHYTGGFGQLNAMRDAAQEGVPLPLASSRGIYFGPWCIRTIHDEQGFFHPNGDPRKVEFDIVLVVYG